MKRKLLRIALVGLTSFSVAFGAVLAYIINKPQTLQPSQYHPLNLLLKIKGYDVNPWVPVNPNIPYVLKFVDVEWPVLWQGRYKYSDFLDYAFSQFQNVYPNVDIQRTTLKLAEFEGYIQKAVQSGETPDIYSGPFLGELVHSRIAIPITPFISQDELLLMDINAVESVMLKKDIWAWPRWLEPAYLAANTKMLTISGVNINSIQRHGWSWDDFMEVLQKISHTCGITPIALDSFSPRLLKYLLLSSGITSIYDIGASQISVANPDTLLPQFEFLENILESDFVPKNIKRMHLDIYDLFWSGQVSLIGPVHSGFLRSVEQRQKMFESKQVTPIIDVSLLPIPHQPGCTSKVPINVYALHILSSPNSIDSSKARLAVELGRFLTRGESAFLSTALHTIPAYLPDQESWMVSPEIITVQGQYMVESLKTGIVPRILGHGMDSVHSRFWKECVPAILADFLANKVSPVEAALLMSEKAGFLIGN